MPVVLLTTLGFHRIALTLLCQTVMTIGRRCIQPTISENTTSIGKWFCLKRCKLIKFEHYVPVEFEGIILQRMPLAQI